MEVVVRKLPLREAPAPLDTRLSREWHQIALRPREPRGLAAEQVVLVRTNPAQHALEAVVGGPLSEP